VGRLIAKLWEDCERDANCDSQNRTGSQWIDELAKNTGTPSRTIRDWWSAFCRETGLSITPRQASDEHRNAFFAWLATAPNAKPSRLRWGGFV
jgi:hypothetical protein